MISFIRFADNLSAWFGKAFAWLILLMSIGTGYEVFVRYVLNNPTAWALDVSFIMYGTLFMMGGAYTLSRGGHVRGDFLYRLFQPRTQGMIDLVLYIIFFFPGVTALILAAGILLFIQGIAQVCRCLIAIRSNYWLEAEEDVFETEDLMMREANKAEKGHLT